MTDLSVSFAPDGSSWYGSTSRLSQLLHRVASTAVWQREYARALQTWADSSPLNFHFVADDGSPSGTYGLVQGDARFGDIRLGAIPLDGALAATIFPSTKGGSQGGSDSGDMTLNTGYTFHLGSTYDLYSLLLHESGHALGLGHSGPGTVMYATYTDVK